MARLTLPAIIIAAVVMLAQCWAAAAAENSEGKANGRENQPPVLVVNIPLQTFPQDNYGNKGYHLVNLSKYFSDDSDAGNLTHSVVFATNPAHICGTVDGQFLSFTTPTPDWYGQEKFRVRAGDTGGLWAESNNFTVRVTPGPSDPHPLPGIHVTKGKECIFNLTPYITDEDSKLEDIVVWTNSSFVTVEGLLLHLLYTGELTSEDVKVTVNNTIDQYSTLLRVIIDPKAYWQIIRQPPWEIIVTEYSIYTENLSDYAVGNETLLGKLTWNVTELQAGEPPILDSVTVQDRVLRIVPAPHKDGRATFTINAYQSDEKIWSCNVSVTEVLISLENYVPRLKEMTVSEHQNVSFSLLNDALPEPVVFWTNTTLFKINNTGWVNFNPEQKDVGRWRIYYCVTAHGFGIDCASRVLTLTVLNVNDPPNNVTILRPQNFARFTVGVKISFEGNATDVDGDILQYRWMSDDVVHANGKACSISKFHVGRHNIYLEVFDHEYIVKSQPVTITVEPAPVVTSVNNLAYPMIIIVLVAACVLTCAVVARIFWPDKKP